MLRKFIQFIVASTLSIGVLTLAGPVASPASASFDGGTGTAADPYLVANCTQLQAIRDPSSNLSKHYKLSANIDCSSVNPFTPLSNSTTYFTGSLDGAGFEVSNLTIGCSASTCGLFPTFKSGTAVTITDITFRTVSAGGAGLSQIGVIVGTLNAPLTLENVELIDPVVTGASNIGGLIGYFQSTSATSSKLIATDIAVRKSVDFSRSASCRWNSWIWR